MKSETLRSLLVDKELGELTPDVVELLDAYVTSVPEARSQIDIVARTVHTTRETMRRFPELIATPSTTNATPRIEVIRRYSLTGPGKRDPSVTVTRAPDHRYEGLWAQYQVAYDSRRGAFVVAQRQ